MARLILHVGPGKCGSSSIQEFFSTQNRPCIQKTRFRLLDPKLISELNSENPGEPLFDAFSVQLSGDLRGCDCLILSHEFLFQNPHAVKNICFVARDVADKIFIIGYSRRQSDFLVSAYSQWLFRSPDRINEVASVLTESHLDPILFTGLERQIIASINNDFYSARQLSEYGILDWNNSYNNISRLIGEFGVTVKCGTLPKKESDPPLIQDFCAKADLTLHCEMEGAARIVSNSSFSPDVVEAINNAVVLGVGMPGPHEGNDVIDLLSAKIKPAMSYSSDFLSVLKSYIDGFYWESNKQLCDKYGLSPAYFSPIKVFSKPEILKVIINEERHRALNKSALILNYRELSARLIDLCINLVKA